jgi:hypothetical protein
VVEGAKGRLGVHGRQSGRDANGDLLRFIARDGVGGAVAKMKPSDLQA